MSTDPLLVVRFGSLGDVVLSFAAGRALAEARPERPIVYLVKERYAELVGAQPWVAETLALTGEERGAGGAAVWRSRLAARPWSAILDLQGNPRSRALTSGLGAPVVRWPARRLERRLQVWLRFLGPGLARRFTVEPAWRRYLGAAAALGAGPGEPPRVAFGEAEAREAERLLGGPTRRPGARSPRIALAPAAAWPTKEIPQATLTEVVERLGERGARLVLLSTRDERRRLAALDAVVRGRDGVLWYDGERLPRIAALLARSDAALVPDSGLMHLAAAVGTPVAAVFGSTAPALGFAPAGEGHRVLGRALPCRPCTIHGRERCPLGHLRCLRAWSAEELVEPVLALAAAPRLRGAEAL